MRIEARLFEILTGFFVLAAVVYGVLTAMFAHGGLEWAGTTALVLTAGLSLIIGSDPVAVAGASGGASKISRSRATLSFQISATTASAACRNFSINNGWVARVAASLSKPPSDTWSSGRMA